MLALFSLQATAVDRCEPGSSPQIFFWNWWKIQFNQVLSILDRFDPFWTDLIQSDEKRKCHFYLHATKHYLFYWTLYQFKISFVIMNCCQLWHLDSVFWFEKPLFSAVLLRHTIKTAVEVRRTAENCGFLSYKICVGSFTFFPWK